MKKTLSAALCIITLAFTAPASACFSSPEEIQRILAEQVVWRAIENAVSPAIDSLEVSGDQAVAIVSFDAIVSSGTEHRRLEQTMWLAREASGWRVTSESYSVPVGTFRSTEAIRRR